jgi:putative transposase
VGDAYDNALCESFFATLECELLDRRRFPTQVEARMAVFDFIEGWSRPAPAAFRSGLSVADQL